MQQSITFVYIIRWKFDQRKDYSINFIKYVKLIVSHWYTQYIRASDSHRCVGTLEAPTSYGNNRLCLRAVGARKLVEILIKGAILSPLLTAAANMNCTSDAPVPSTSDENGRKHVVLRSLIARDMREGFIDCIVIAEYQIHIPIYHIFLFTL